MNITARMASFAATFGSLLALNSCESLSSGAGSGPATAPSYVTLESTTGRIVYSFNVEEKRAIGMLSHVMVACVVLDWVNSRGVDKNRMLQVPVSPLLQSNTNVLRLQAGDQISLRDALYSMVLTDDTVSAITLAHACGLDLNPQAPTAAFVKQMNSLAQRLGMRSTRFKTPQGSPQNSSTALDLARVGIYAAQHPGFTLTSSQQSVNVTVHHRDGSVMSHPIQNTNRLLYANMGVNGLKAARSRAAGACLMASARRPSIKYTPKGMNKELTQARNLIVVILGMGPKSRYQAATGMLEDGWGAWEQWLRNHDPYGQLDPLKFVQLPK